MFARSLLMCGMLLQPSSSDGSNRILLTVGGYGVEAVHDVILPSARVGSLVTVEPTLSFPTSSTKTINSLKLSYSGRFLVTGGADGGAVCVYVPGPSTQIACASSALLFWFTAGCVRPVVELGWFARVGMHDGDSVVHAATTSFDDKYLLSAGEDGIISVVALRSADIERAAVEAAAKGDEIAMEFKV